MRVYVHQPGIEVTVVEDVSETGVSSFFSRAEPPSMRVHTV